MWPFERRAAIVVAGRERAELWSRGQDGFSCAGDRPITFDDRSAPQSLGETLQALFKAARATPDGRVIHMVLESAWLPVIGLDVGDALWTQRKLRALLEHRLAELHGAEPAVCDWDLRLDHRPGDAMALGFGLAKEVKDTVLAAGAAAAVSIASVQPAFGWGMDRWLPAARRAHAAWWMWREQDRTLVAHLRHGRVWALNPAAALVQGAGDGRALLARESVRLGVGSADALAWIGGWHTTGAESEGALHRVAFVGLQRRMARAKGTLA